MTTYVVRLSGAYTERWSVQAGSPEQAARLVARGHGAWIEGYWDDKPASEVVHEFHN
ncbi:MAG: hypothetical protein ACYDBQ_11215 [Thermoplasmatota archaeon]